jgi:nucleoside triphosphate pyrophosphatase
MTMLILASASGVRARLLREAGVRFGVRPADVDEALLKNRCRANGTSGADMAVALAEAKALNVSDASPQALVLGCDQVLVCEGRLFDKARDLAEARETLCLLRGRDHQLVSACVLAQAGKPVWRHAETATLRMRMFSDTFLDSYLRAQGMTVLSSVGCYHLENRGGQLFEKIDGDFFAILGLPLIPLLGALREHGIIES